jgi:hypothetical protein
MPYYLLSIKHEIIAESETNNFTETGHVVVVAASRDLLPRVRENKDVFIKASNVSKDWDWSKLSKYMKNKVVQYYNNGEYLKIQSVHNTHSLTNNKLCCGDHSALIKLQVSKGITDGIL